MPPRLDLSAFGGSDSEGEEIPPKRQLELTALKTKVFSHGITKKTRKDLEREAEEKKKAEEERALALVNAEYEAAFEGSGAVGAPLGGTRGSGYRGRPIGPGGGFVRAGGAPMEAPFQPPKGPAAMGYNRPRPPPPRMPSPPPAGPPKSKGKRAMDSFLEEIKNNQTAREQRLGNLAKQEGSSVSALAGLYITRGIFMDTTNLFISNLPSNINEESLGLFFAKLGPVGTVKIMWPRGDEDSSVGASMTVSRRNKAGLTGFVSYMQRGAAERAVKEYDGLDWGGSILRVGWSKPVPMPLRPLYGRSPSPSRHRNRDRSETTRRGRSRSRSYSSSRSPPRQRKRSRSPSYSRSPTSRRRRRGSYSSYSSDSRSRSRSRSTTPPPKKVVQKDKRFAHISEEQQKFISTVANRVKDHGKGFEDMLKKNQKENPKFEFLFKEDVSSSDQLSGQASLTLFSSPPLAAGGYASLYSSDSAEDSEKERVIRGKLGKIARKRFEAMLRAMSGRRAEIARGMEFALKRAEAADEVAEVVCQSLRIDATPVPRKMARLHLISDILHNSASPLPNVWKYRQAFESRLPPVFAHLSTVYQSLLAYSGKISADVFKAQVAAVLDIWERWIVFNSESAEYLRGLLDGTQSLAPPVDPLAVAKAENESRAVKLESNEDESRFKTSGFKSSFKPIAAASTAQQSGDDLDGEPIGGDIDGEAMDMDDDLDGEAMEDLDGEEMS
ncbi:U2-associated protein SR140 [Kwoniella heveanensis BCC8398]|uniref:U2-associated protein SR140 n=1 Tax=Kwoniella heveanensis BCC8398 TaxID=1296120 RepID=A0A1B9GK44_9TREE|nr:U2-associated protein SR140 [Kwoniella heveanensis BCC8398]